MGPGKRLSVHLGHELATFPAKGQRANAPSPARHGVCATTPQRGLRGEHSCRWPVKQRIPLCSGKTPVRTLTFEFHRIFMS